MKLPTETRRLAVVEKDTIGTLTNNPYTPHELFVMFVTRPHLSGKVIFFAIFRILGVSKLSAGGF
jgi:hypothetical protein